MKSVLSHIPISWRQYYTLDFKSIIKSLESKSIHLYNFDNNLDFFFPSKAIADQQEGDEVKYCVILNADGVYIATYAALLLNLKLVQCGYYTSEEKSLPISEVRSI